MQNVIVWFEHRVRKDQTGTEINVPETELKQTVLKRVTMGDNPL